MHCASRGTGAVPPLREYLLTSSTYTGEYCLETQKTKAASRKELSWLQIFLYKHTCDSNYIQYSATEGSLLFVKLLDTI